MNSAESQTPDSTNTLIEKLDKLSDKLDRYERDRAEQQKWFDRTWETSKTLTSLAFTLIVSATITVIITAIFK